MKIMKEIGVYIESGSDIIPRIEKENYVECPRCRTKINETYMYNHQKVEIEKCANYFFELAEENNELSKENNRLKKENEELKHKLEEHSSFRLFNLTSDDYEGKR